MAKTKRDTIYWLETEESVLVEYDRRLLCDDLQTFLMKSCQTTRPLLATDDENSFPIMAFGDRGRETARNLFIEFSAVSNMPLRKINCVISFHVSPLFACFACAPLGRMKSSKKKPSVFGWVVMLV